MIFCSRRVFLNVVTQLLDLPTLLNANYFLVDQTKPTGFAGFGDTPHIGMDGDLTFSSGLQFQDTPTTSMHQYFIHYSRVLDVTPYFGLLTASMRNDFSTPMERFINHLTNPQTQMDVYQEIFNKRLQGNNLQIIIMKDDHAVEMCGHIICSFLSEEFGADINFIDPMYRPRTKGQLQYVGNKDRGMQHIMEIRDMIFKTFIQSAIDTAQFGGGFNNLSAFFDNPDLKIEDLFHAYHLLFPNDQLPPGNYTVSHLKQLIIGRIMDSTGKSHEQQKLKDLGVNLFAFDQVFDEYDSAIEEDFSDIT